MAGVAAAAVRRTSANEACSTRAIAPSAPTQRALLQEVQAYARANGYQLVVSEGVLFAADPPWPRSIAVIPISWALIGGSAAVSLGVRADLILWAAAAGLVGHLLATKT